MNERRYQENRDSLDVGGERWFELAANLASLGSALAYRATWNRAEQAWQRDQQSPQRLVYSTLTVITAETGDVVRCSLNPHTRVWEVLFVHAVTRFRGITQSVLPKGGNVQVSRYVAGTTTPSGLFDTVRNELVDIGSGKLVYYEKQGDNLYIYAAECPLA